MNNVNQAEYMNRIQRMLKAKNLLDLTKEALNQGDNYEQKKKDFNKIFT